MKKITFCGNSHMFGENNEQLKNKMLKHLKECIGEDEAEFYLGNYGEFDRFAFFVCEIYREKYKNCKIYFVTPYLDETYLKNCQLEYDKYDDILYPDLERVPKRLAIIKRNEWMIDNADIVFTYIRYTWGGSYNSYKYAQRKKKEIIEL